MDSAFGHALGFAEVGNFFRALLPALIDPAVRLAVDDDASLACIIDEDERKGAIPIGMRDARPAQTLAAACAFAVSRSPERPPAGAKSAGQAT